ncbi:MAG TPA: GAF domain-containing protein [Candidatus Acidoferrales bacterium]|nr:GAF domain-containing protein [Candidatus Acidoferrales bacterium]
MNSSKSKKRQRLPVRWLEETRYAVPIPKDEKQRLAALQRYDILDTAPERNFDTIVRLASHLCNTPIALMVLIDEGRQWFKAKVGVRLKETPRGLAFCAHTIMQRKLFIVPDMRRDRRFAKNPFVASGPKFRFYAGAPLITTDNRALGTLCVIDKLPHKLSRKQKEDLMGMSRLVMTELELRRILRDRAKTTSATVA